MLYIFNFDSLMLLSATLFTYSITNAECEKNPLSVRCYCPRTVNSPGAEVNPNIAIAPSSQRSRSKGVIESISAFLAR